MVRTAQILLDNVRNDRDMSSTTGLKIASFQQLCTLFESEYKAYDGICYFEKFDNLKKEVTFISYSSMVFFLLYYLKIGMTYSALGVTFGLSEGSAHDNIDHFLKILEKVLLKGAFLPQRNIKDIEKFKEYLKNEEDLLVDVSESWTQRPKNEAAQKEMYSGKKNAIR